MTTLIHEEKEVTTRTIRKTAPPEWLLAFWKEIDDKTFGKGFDCFTEDATCNLGIADWHGREQIRKNLRAFIDTGFTAKHDVVEYWDGGSLKVFRELTEARVTFKLTLFPATAEAECGRVRVTQTTLRWEEIFGILLFVGVSGKQVAFEFPCPSPDWWRFMLMRFTKRRKNETERELLAIL